MYTDLYKSHDIHNEEFRQSERRHTLLEKQKQQRNELLDEGRSIEPLKQIFIPKFLKKRKHFLKNKIMLSEWLREVPDDIDKWYIKPCPKGQRVLVIAVDGITSVYNKQGFFVKQFRSNLPGCRKQRNTSLTILDCIYVFSLKEYFVLDALAYGQQSLKNCDADFRFFWIDSKISELKLTEVTKDNEYPFRMIENYKFDDKVAINNFLSMYPIWSNDLPQLDGFLFYHGEASYVHGETPLVGWLFAFMIPELFDIPCLNEKFLLLKPSDYSNYLTYMDQFDEKLRQKRGEPMKKCQIKCGKVGKPEKMDVNDSESIARQAMELELGEADDDDLKDFEIIEYPNDVEYN